MPLFLETFLQFLVENIVVATTNVEAKHGKEIAFGYLQIL